MSNAEVMIRPGTAADLEAVAAVWWAAEEAEPTAPTPWFDHLLRTGTLVVAETRGAVVGFAGARRLGSVTSLTDCFVRPATQSAGVGRRLVEAVVAPGTPAVTLASPDPRAVSLYVRAGMLPRWPAYYLEGASAGVEAPAGVRAYLDAACHPFLASTAEALSWVDPLVALTVHRAAGQIGAALVTTMGFRPRHPGHATVLATVSTSPGDAVAVVAAALVWMRAAGASAVGLQVPGPHPALARLLDAGLRIVDADMCCATGPTPDPARRTMMGDVLAVDPPPGAVRRRAPAGRRRPRRSS